MAALTQKLIDKFPIISLEELATKSNSMRNYVVQFGLKGNIFGNLEVHVGFASNNHLITIKELLLKHEGKWILYGLN